MTVLNVWDKLKGLVVTFKDGASESFSPPDYEALFSPIDYVQKYTVDDPLAKRIQSMEVREWRVEVPRAFFSKPVFYLYHLFMNMNLLFWRTLSMITFLTLRL